MIVGHSFEFSAKMAIGSKEIVVMSIHVMVCECMKEKYGKQFPQKNI